MDENDHSSTKGKRDKQKKDFTLQEQRKKNELNGKLMEEMNV